MCEKLTQNKKETGIQQCIIQKIRFQKLLEENQNEHEELMVCKDYVQQQGSVGVQVLYQLIDKSH